MQLPPALRARLVGGPGAAEPLPVVRDPAAGRAPFRFVARKVRFPREHEFFEDGDVQRHLYLQDVLTQVAEEPQRSRVPEFTCQVAGCCQVFDTLEGYEHHYHTRHRHACSFCKRAFPSAHLLDTHILEWHDALFQILSERQDMVSVPQSPPRQRLRPAQGWVLHGGGQSWVQPVGLRLVEYQCLVEGCTEKFKTSSARKDHMVRLHLYPADFWFDKPRKSRGLATPGPCVPLSAEALGGGGEQSEGDAMEVCAAEDVAIPWGAPSESRAVAARMEKRTYSRRIPSTICFGQGAARGFKSTKKRDQRL
ncbi:zinc finger protein 511 isoform X2 [Choloepus didactylus]|uniref:zinc finger protein 511 isoform X2 n=1 Tax=Choloepus didactylus TaxID=27675 RepID=UPI0018A0E872|nr:zinc finger protein 511 isoform X2 [Choloepus didactylus]